MRTVIGSAFVIKPKFTVFPDEDMHCAVYLADSVEEAEATCKWANKHWGCTYVYRALSEKPVEMRLIQFQDELSKLLIKVEGEGKRNSTFAIRDAQAILNRLFPELKEYNDTTWRLL